MRGLKKLGSVILLGAIVSGGAHADVLTDCRAAILKDETKREKNTISHVEEVMGYDHNNNMYTINIVKNMISFSDKPNYQCELSKDAAGIQVINVYASGMGTF
jgi:hypothetical protein